MIYDNTEKPHNTRPSDMSYNGVIRYVQLYTENEHLLYGT